MTDDDTLVASNQTIAPVLVVDLEATCCNEGTIEPGRMEIIEVGAVWAMPSGQVIDQFQSFVRPIERPQLTRFCMELTHIEQAHIDTAPSWSIVAAELARFAQEHQSPGSFWGSWGEYDRRQVERECARHGIADPLARLPHKNLKASFAKARKIRQVGMSRALHIAGLELDGEHHRALSDALNIAKLLPLCTQPKQE
jgi:inhibitor of KinA sporulation pathway (predicted exonuclease)